MSSQIISIFFGILKFQKVLLRDFINYGHLIKNIYKSYSSNLSNILKYF